MTRLKLNMEALRVESFEAEARAAGSGTILAFSGNSDDTLCDILTCGGGDTCDGADRAIW
jgi:DUF971 family protein